MNLFYVFNLLAFVLSFFNLFVTVVTYGMPLIKFLASLTIEKWYFRTCNYINSSSHPVVKSPAELKLLGLPLAMRACLSVALYGHSSHIPVILQAQKYFFSRSFT